MKIKEGFNGNLYAVFNSEEEADEYESLFSGLARSCFGGYYNAYLLKEVDEGHKLEMSVSEEN